MMHLNKHPELPLVTICMPTKNRAWSLENVLKVIERLDYPKDRLKLVFVDDYSIDGTFEILNSWTSRVKQHFFDITLIQKRTNIPQARNVCINNMEGDFILYWDSDVIPPEDLLKQMIEIMKFNNKIGVIGADYVYEHDNIVIRMSGKPITNKFTHALFMGFTLIRKEVFKEVGGFNEFLDVGEDTEFCIRVVEKTDYKIMWAPKPVLHLKPAGKDKKIRHGFSGWLSYNFRVRGEQYAKSFHKLPLLLKLRIFYYMFLPLVIIASLLLAYYTSVIWIPVILIAYLLPGLFLAIYSSNIRKGLVSFFIFNVPTGLALSYGTLIYMLKKHLRIGSR